jgi:TPR repeat protein
LRRAAAGGISSAQLRFAVLLRQGRVIRQDLGCSAHYLKLTSDQGSIEEQLEYSIFLLHGDGVSKKVGESERYLRLAAAQDNIRAQM